MLAALDVSDPDRPALETSIALPMLQAYPTDLQVAGTFAYVSYGGYGMPGGVAIVDIHDPANVALRSFYHTSSVDTLRVVGDRLYLASGWVGLQIAQVLELDQQAWLPFALRQAAR